MLETKIIFNHDMANICAGLFCVAVAVAAKLYWASFRMK